MTNSNEIRSFRDLHIWKDAIRLVKLIYETTGKFPTAENYGLTSQVRRAAVSVPSNIAEGHTRGHRSEFKQFLFIALGSLAELETQILIANEPGYLKGCCGEDIVKEIDALGKRIRSLILKLTPNPQSPTPEDDCRNN
jgi:four helix bundle protein